MQFVDEITYKYHMINMMDSYGRRVNVLSRDQYLFQGFLETQNQ